MSIDESTRMNRRLLLQRAALGAAAVSSLARVAPAKGAAMPNGATIDAFEGRLLSKSGSTLLVQRGASEESVTVTPAATLWKGSDDTLAAFSEGDDILVRLVNGQLTNAWANLIMLRGTIEGSVRGGYEAVDDRSRARMQLVTDGRSALENALTGGPVMPASLPAGTWVQAAGSIDSSPLSTRVLHMPAVAAHVTPLNRINLHGPHSTVRVTAVLPTVVTAR